VRSDLDDGNAESGDGPRIGDYALISDCQGAALVSRGGSIDWACLPRFDSPACFARLLGSNAGAWRIAPVESPEVERAYLPETLVLCTRFRTASGTVELTDALVFDAGEHEHNIGRGSPHLIVRRVTGIEGEVDMELACSPRSGYGLVEPVFIPEDGGARSLGGPVGYRFLAEVPVTVDGGDCLARFRVRRGETRHFGLLVSPAWRSGDVADEVTLDALGPRLEETIAGWRSWSSLHQTYGGPYAELVRHSGRVLQALTFAPSGAIVAAPTTSLPETPGGTRNWDYRYCWVRDASLTLEALWVAACPDEAADFFRFFATTGGSSLRAGRDLQILYGVGGEHLVPEHELDHLDGYGHSRPVRIGNAAATQTQLDVYGELLSAACLLSEQVAVFDDVTAQFLVAAADRAAARWCEPDQGIWEIRDAPRHFVHSKLMCWVALNSAIRLAPRLHAEDRVEEWSKVRAAIRDAIETRGWSDRAGSFTQSFGSDELDASCLLLLLTGFLPADDPRMGATVEAIAEHLTDTHGFVYRYLSPDGLSGGEGTFVICTFWLVACLAELGETDRARGLFERTVGFANDVGLLSEEIDPVSGELLGNFPQAFTHIGLVNAAWAIARAEDVG
jgi:GH15 family glucan-1,4-alpha-glucosidase